MQLVNIRAFLPLPECTFPSPDFPLGRLNDLTAILLLKLLVLLCVLLCVLLWETRLSRQEFVHTWPLFDCTTAFELKLLDAVDCIVKHFQLLRDILHSLIRMRDLFIFNQLLDLSHLILDVLSCLRLLFELGA